jgi:hypothetical protein
MEIGKMLGQAKHFLVFHSQAIQAIQTIQTHLEEVVCLLVPAFCSL